MIYRNTSPFQPLTGLVAHRLGCFVTAATLLSTMLMQWSRPAQVQAQVQAQGETQVQAQRQAGSPQASMARTDLGPSLTGVSARPAPTPQATPLPAPLELVPVINLKRHNERLPRVLLIGDSISFGYSEPVAKKLSQKAVVYRINGRVKSTVTGSLVLDTRSGLQNLDRWLTQKWDVIHFNWGLHDLKLDKIGQRQVPIEEYEHNLEALVTKLKGSGARLIWATTTPVPEKIAGTVRRWKDETPYNETALRVMQKHGIVIDDLHAVASRGIAAEKPGKLQGVANVHFTPRGSELLADAVAAQIDSMLAVPPSPLQPSQGPPSPVQPLGVR